MTVYRILAALLVACAMSDAVVLVQAQSRSETRSVGTYTASPGKDAFHVSFGLRKYINSFTSYQYPNAFSPFQDPLSRLEWPWEQICWVAKADRSYGSLRVNLEYATSRGGFSDLKAQDSDWTGEPFPPWQKTIFSQGKDRPRCWTVDLSLSHAVPRVPWLRAVGGYRAQQFKFTYYDLKRADLLGRLPARFPGEAIAFSQYYKHWYVGGTLPVVLELGSLFRSPTPARVGAQLHADVSLVTGKNVDDHLLRTPAPRYTTEETSGSAWHAGLTMELNLNTRFAFGFEGHFMRIRSRGSHRMEQPGMDLSWSGAVVWSDQAYVGVLLTASF